MGTKSSKYKFSLPDDIWCLILPRCNEWWPICRLVCHRIDEICTDMKNRGELHIKLTKGCKSQIIARHCTLDQFKWLVSMKFIEINEERSDTKSINDIYKYCATYCNVDIAKWVYKGNVYSLDAETKADMVMCALGMDAVPFLEWIFASNGILRLYDEYEIAEKVMTWGDIIIVFAMANNRHETLTWLCGKRNIDVSTTVVRWCAERGHIKLLEVLHKRYSIIGKMESDSVVCRSTKHQHVLQWAMKRGCKCPRHKKID